MPDVLTHVLIAYAVGAVAVRLTALPDRHLPVVMVGAVMPDVMKATVLLDVSVGSVSGVPYSFWAVHTLGGVVVLGGLGALTVRGSDRRVAFLSLLAGGVSHLFLDLFVIRVDGLAPPYLFPFVGWLPPAGNLYASTDVWPAGVAIAVALLVWIGRRRTPVR
ncbi:metal-dependent hydrolase [Halobellus marinus]|jgi:membrane-bound metal-dependent hydrolase YbcI (DUF457 family)|uniref:metal-dependent hydrolase n=1 Tax=Halobellus TaxID=1073986 RepID=UPI0028AD9331|nr:metal-dependent hydrolase [Halobellus sp. DFY28]